MECFIVSGALTVPYGTSKAVPQKFYFCVNKFCLDHNPPWTNIQQLSEFEVDVDISDSRKAEVYNFLDL